MSVVTNLSEVLHSNITSMKCYTNLKKKKKMIIDLYDTTMYIKQLQLFVIHLMGKKKMFLR